MTTIKLDLTGLKCPLPALMTRKALKRMPAGDSLEVHCTDPLSVIDIPVLIRETGPAGWLRVTVGLPAEMAAFRDALDKVLGEA